MTIPYNQLAYSQGQGSSQIPAFIFETRDPTAEDYNINFKLYTGWVNTVTKAIWYLEAIIPSNGFLTSQWRSVGPIVVALVPPTTFDYQFPIGQTWIDTVAMQYWGLVNVTGTVATWENLSSGVAAGILTLTGNTGGSVAGDGARNVNVIGSGGVTVTGTPLTNTLTISLSGGSTAIDSVGVDSFTGPGTNPVLPTAAGLITVTGAQVAAATTPNVIRTDSLSANTYTIEVQRSKAEPASTVGSNGVAHFSSTNFTVDNNGFVAFEGGSGTFTPGIAFGGASVGVVYVVQEGRYTRIGDLVFFDVYMDISNKGASVGNATITGLPFTVGSPSSQVCFLQIDEVVFTANYFSSFLRPITGSTTAEMWETGTNSDAVNLTNASFNVDPTIRCQGFYFF